MFEGWFKCGSSFCKLTFETHAKTQAGLETFLWETGASSKNQLYLAKHRVAASQAAVSRVSEPVDKVDQDKDADFEDVEEERQRLDAAFDEVEDLEGTDSDDNFNPFSDDGNI